jgi:hypothetical protein
MLGRASQAGDKRDPVTEARPKEEPMAERRKRQRKRPRDPGGVHSRCRPQGVSSLLEPASISMVEGEADLARLPPDGEVAEGRPLLSAQVAVRAGDGPPMARGSASELFVTYVEVELGERTDRVEGS